MAGDEKQKPFASVVDAFVADGRIAYMDGEGLKEAHNAEMKGVVDLLGQAIDAVWKLNQLVEFYKKGKTA